MAAGFPEFLVAWVDTQPDLVAMLGGPGNLRVTPWQAVRRDRAPRITFTQISGEMVRGLSGPLGTIRQRWQIDCWGQDQATARQLTRLILGASGEQRLDGYLGTLVGVHIKSCVLVDQRDNSEPLGPGSDAGNPCLSLDFAVAYQVA